MRDLNLRGEYRMRRPVSCGVSQPISLFTDLIISMKWCRSKGFGIIVAALLASALVYYWTRTDGVTGDAFDQVRIGMNVGQVNQAFGKEWSTRTPVAKYF